jgi:hypothetical protein
MQENGLAYCAIGMIVLLFTSLYFRWMNVKDLPEDDPRKQAFFHQDDYVDD